MQDIEFNLKTNQGDAEQLARKRRYLRTKLGEVTLLRVPHAQGAKAKQGLLN